MQVQVLNRYIRWGVPLALCLAAGCGVGNDDGDLFDPVDGATSDAGGTNSDVGPVDADADGERDTDALDAGDASDAVTTDSGTMDSGPADATMSDSGTDADAGTERCVDDETFFEARVQPAVIDALCVSCHTASGAAGGSDLVFVGPIVPDYLEENREALADIAGYQRDGQSIVLLKPSGRVEHGGGTVAAVGSEPYLILEEFVARLSDPVVCDDVSEPETDDGVLTLDSRAALRRVSLLLLGRIPTDDEVAAVRSGGDGALRTVVRAMMDDEVFVERVAEMFNDALLTDRYLAGTRGVQLLDGDRFPMRYWYEAYDDGREGPFRAALNEAVAREPLALIEHIVRTDRPFTELLTADYVMVNDYTARSYGLSDAEPDLDDPASHVFRAARLEGQSHAGVLTTTAFLNRFPTTPTNRNRHRARVFFDRFLATDILALADRPIDPTVSDYHNPTLNDPTCTVCHAMLDPVAGAFQNWDDGGHWGPRDEGWYPEMDIPGFGDLELPAVERGAALGWLAEQAVRDRRFTLAMVHIVWRALMGQEPLRRPGDDSDSVALAAWEAQRSLFDEVAAAFEAADHDIKVLVLELVLSDAVLASAADEATAPGPLLTAGPARLLTPEELSRKIESTTGYPWRNRAIDRDYLLDRYRLLFGGIDSDAVIDRLRDPNGIILAIAERMAYDVSCRITVRDWSLDAADRRLFPFVETTFVPETADGFAIPEAQARIRQNLVYLHDRLLGEQLDPDSEEIDATYALFYDVWADGISAYRAGDVSRDLPWQCRSRQNFWTGEDLPLDRRIERDDNYTVRAWMAVTAYLLGDYRFLYE